MRLKIKSSCLPDKHLNDSHFLALGRFLCSCSVKGVALFSPQKLISINTSQLSAYTSVSIVTCPPGSGYSPVLPSSFLHLQCLCHSSPGLFLPVRAGLNVFLSMQPSDSVSLPSQFQDEMSPSSSNPTISLHMVAHSALGVRGSLL